jgi:hypothetical protein
MRLTEGVSQATVTDPNPAAAARSTAQSNSDPNSRARHDTRRRASTRES